MPSSQVVHRNICISFKLSRETCFFQELLNSVKGQKERLWLLLKDLRLVLSGRKERLTEKSEEALGVDEHVHYLDYGDGFTSALISKRIKFYKF